MTATMDLSDYPLSHYSRNASIRLSSQPQGPRETFKPRGLWVSCDGPDDWLSWCESEEFYSDTSHANRFVVKLRDDANVLVLKDARDFADFHARWRIGRSDKLYGDYIAWPPFASAYDGILIPEYHWEYRLTSPHSSWYYPWDCASGCIWGADAIASIKRDRKWKTPKWRTYEERMA